MHLVDFKRRFARPDQSLQRERFSAARSPTAFSALIEKGTIPRKLQSQAAGRKPFPKWKASALIAAIHLFEKHTHDRAVRLVSDEKLILERTKFAANVAGDAAGRLAHLRIREVNCGRLQFWNFFRFHVHTAT